MDADLLLVEVTREVEGTAARDGILGRADIRRHVVALRREAPHIGLSRDFVIYDSTDQLTVMKQALRSIGMEESAIQPRMALSRTCYYTHYRPLPLSVAGCSVSRAPWRSWQRR